MIHISETAARHIARMRDEEGQSADSLLRVNVANGGCSGLKYKLEFDLTSAPDDKIVEDHGVKVVLDPKSVLYVVGMELDFEGGLNGKGFVFKNPNAKKSCSCGISFNV